MIKYSFMKSKRTNEKIMVKETNQENKVNINILKGRILKEEKKKQIQNRVLFVSAILSVGIISYLSSMIICLIVMLFFLLENNKINK